MLSHLCSAQAQNTRRWEEISLCPSQNQHSPLLRQGWYKVVPILSTSGFSSWGFPTVLQEDSPSLPTFWEHNSGNVLHQKDDEAHFTHQQIAGLCVDEKPKKQPFLPFRASASLAEQQPGAAAGTTLVARGSGCYCPKIAALQQTHRLCAI